MRDKIDTDVVLIHMQDGDLHYKMALEITRK